MKQDGTLWAWGHNYVGQLGLGDTTTRLTLWAWGFNGNGELGLGDSTDRWIPTQLASGGP